MKITFIRPNIFDQQTLASMEVLVFAILKSLTPSNIETVFYDERLEQIPYDDPTDLVAITIETFTARRAYQIAMEYRRRNVAVVVGGFHPTFMPNEAMHFADSVIQGDAELVWPVVIQDFMAGKLKRLYPSTGYPSMDGMDPDRSIFKGKNYVPMTLMQFSRGCKFNCNFCSIRAFYGANMRQRPVNEVVEEIEKANSSHVLFVDDNLFINLDKTRELLNALIPLNIRWSCQISIDVARHDDILNLMKRSGCIGALIGIESLDPENLKSMNKAWNLKWSDYETSFKKLQDAGVMIYGSFVFGYDNDTADVFDRAVDFAVRHRFVLAGFNPLMPTPGTRMYDDLVAEGRMIHKHWWLDPTYRYGEAVFTPRKMTADEFMQGCYRSRSAFSEYSSIGYRVWDRRTNLGSPYRLWAYLVANSMLRREVHSKQDMMLGSETAQDPFIMVDPDARNVDAQQIVIR